LHVNELNEYLVIGVTRINENGAWGGFILNVNDKLSQQYIKIPAELNFNGNIIGGEFGSKIVENNNILLYGVLNNSQGIVTKYTSTGELIWFRALEGIYSNLQIMNIIKFQNNYFFIARRYNTGGYPSAITIIGKMSIEGEIIFIKTLEKFTLGYDIEIYDESSFLISSVKYFYNENQYIGPSNNYNKAQPFILNIDLDGNIIWQSKIDDLDTDLFHPSLFFTRKGTDGIYCIYRRRTYANEAKITKLDFSGNVLWSKPINKIKNFPPYYVFSNIEDFTLDNENNMYLIGFADESNCCGPTYFGVAKFDSNGNYVNSYTNLGSENKLSGFGIKIDKQNNIITASENSKKQNITLLKLNKNLVVQ
ncbi:MAG: hypothetical protein Q7U08_00390, partial [Flavobacteriaceae bacterium]|nr:hypothetical protein [Flavobacteriaceae bacterium]